MLQSGFIIVFSGLDFRPEEFLRDSSLQALAIRSLDAGERKLEFDDIHDGTYPLDVATEAMDLLREHRTEFIRLSRFPGVTNRQLSFFGDAGTCTTQFEPNDIALLCELALGLSIVCVG